MIGFYSKCLGKYSYLNTIGFNIVMFKNVILIYCCVIIVLIMIIEVKSYRYTEIFIIVLFY